MYMYMYNTHHVFTSSLITRYDDALKQVIEKRIDIDQLSAFKGKVTECTAALLEVNFSHLHTTQYYSPNRTVIGLARVRIELLELKFYQQQQVDGNILREWRQNLMTLKGVISIIIVYLVASVSEHYMYITRLHWCV